MSDPKVDVIGLAMTMKIRPEYQGAKHPLQVNQVQRTVKKVGRSDTAKTLLAIYDEEKNHEQYRKTLAILPESALAKTQKENQPQQE